ncbi:hypothetical protein EMCRGX_G021156 [Ephydatia muelleri]
MNMRSCNLWLLLRRTFSHFEYAVSEGVTSAEQRTLKAAIIGAPNAGKSTLVNQLIGQKVFAVSPKVHTTSRKAAGVYTHGNAQIVLLDTPGIVTYQYGRKLKMPKSFIADPYRSLMEAQLIIVMVDASNKWTREHLHPSIVQALCNNPHIPSVLVLNKVDIVRHKHTLLAVTESLTSLRAKGAAASGVTAPPTTPCPPPLTTPETCPTSDEVARGTPQCAEDSCPEEKAGSKGTSWPHFSEVFMLSALTNDGIDTLKSYLISRARPGVWEYNTSELTDQPQSALVNDIIREKLFLHLHKEIPYVVTQDTVSWEQRDEDTLYIHQNLNCKSSNQASIIIGPAGRTIQQITAEAKTDIEGLFKCPVDLVLNVRAQKT